MGKTSDFGKVQTNIEGIHDLRVIDPKTIPHVLKEGEMGCAIEWMVRDHKTGKVQEHVIKRSESFVQQFLQIMCVVMNLGGPNNVRDTGNTLRGVYVDWTGSLGYWLDVLAGAGTITFGIVVGTGAVAPTISDYALGTIIQHDAAPPTAGRLQYGAVTFGAPSADATTSQMTITRNFANSSGGAITVNEIGLYCRAYYSAAAGYFMIIRDVIAGGIAVPPGQTLTVNYRPQAVV
jgi:hypothetical protein